MKHTEIEIQVQIEKSKELLEFLDREGKFKYETHQIDKYFTPKHRDFIATRPVDEWLRLRQSEKGYSITYKNWHHNKKTGKTNHCDEFETTFGDFESMKKILDVLDFKSIATVDKIRKSYHWKDYEVSLDSVKNLGEFVEVEYKGEGDADPAKTTDEMMEFLNNHGCGEVKRNYQGYPFMLMFPDEVKYEKV